MKKLALSLALAAGIAATPTLAEELAPVPSSLMNRNGVVCVKVTTAGKVSEVFVVRSTGDGAADADLVDWVRTLSWPKAPASDTSRNTWQPLPVAMGKAPVPDVPETCSPPIARR
ncbi:MAG TPA: hypothetical protein VFV30_11020 [Novosphingobium sp.]|nr:hypothetical protein [Novosphingobium sp.]